MVQIDFCFDFGSPNAYLSHKVIPGIEHRTGEHFTYVPTLLGGLFKMTGNQSPMQAFGHIKNKLPYEGLETRRFVDRHELHAYRQNPHFPVNTLQIMRGAVAAKHLGCFEPYIDAVYAAMWEDGLKMDDPAVIAEALTAAGLPAQAILEKTQDQAVKDELVANTQAAFDRGAFGSPTFVGSEIYFGKDRLRDVEEEIMRQKTLAA